MRTFDPRTETGPRTAKPANAQQPRSHRQPRDLHPLGALVVGGVAGAIFVQMFQISTNKWKIDDVLGVWALHGLCGLWGGSLWHLWVEVLGGLGGVTFAAQLVGSLAGPPLASRLESLFTARSNLLLASGSRPKRNVAAPIFRFTM